ncbi:serine/arginine repetitive matrix protein 1-like isoform X4 [Bufo gargarizans]|uniref:serine/arginine repetitive matrix protein 1-like isoform X4 n=1 Tax=Bufo gargarizans TaxID=30331 RepID=UPI001CF2429A|nr:serine/arginine repetitive matrix protein 1-like isoform X4 [Bufo gargarizans]
MAEAVEVMLRRLREAADTRGSDWLEEQVTALLRGAEVGTSGPTPLATRSRRARPPARLSPDLPPRVRRRVRSPTRDPPRREHSKATAASRRGRNPHVRRDPPEAVGPSPQPTTSATRESGPGSAGSPPVPRSGRPAQRGRGSGSRGSSGAARSARAARRRLLQDGPLSVAHEAAPVGAGDGRRPRHDALLSEEEDEAVLDGSPPQSRPLGHEDRRADAYMEERELRRPFPEGGQFATGPDTVEDRGRPRAIPNAPSRDPAGVLPANSASTHQRNVADPGVVRQESGPAAAGFTAPGQLGGAPLLVWILGHSFVFWGALRADVRQNGRQLGFDRGTAIVRWIGRRGMVWGSVLQEVHRQARLDRVPDILVLHVGGNDLGVRPCRELIRDIRFDFLRLWSLFPSVVTVWSDIVPRKVWREARSVERLNKARIKLNRVIGRFCAKHGAVVVRHPELEAGTGGFWRQDGVHLNAVGIDLWSLDLQGGVETAIRVWRNARA